MKNVTWTPFIKNTNVSKKILDQTDCQQIYLNSRYKVFVKWNGVEKITNNHLKNKEICGIMHLSIKNHFNSPIHDWREMQRIKNEICGTACEGIEICPSKDKLVDTCNQYHLWVLPPYCSLDIGYTDRLVCYESKKEINKFINNLKLKNKNIQRDWEKHHKDENLKDIGPAWDHLIK